MATKQDLDAALDKLAQAVSDAAGRVSNDLAALQAKIDAGATGPDLQPEVDKINAGITAIQNIDPAASTPVASVSTTTNPPAA